MLCCCWCKIGGSKFTPTVRSDCLVFLLLLLLLFARFCFCSPRCETNVWPCSGDFSSTIKIRFVCNWSLGPATAGDRALKPPRTVAGLLMHHSSQHVPKSCPHVYPKRNWLQCVARPSNQQCHIRIQGVRTVRSYLWLCEIEYVLNL